MILVHYSVRNDTRHFSASKGVDDGTSEDDMRTLAEHTALTVLGVGRMKGASSATIAEVLQFHNFSWWTEEVSDDYFRTARVYGRRRK